MKLDRQLAPYIVFADDSVLSALGKITANQQRIVFCVDSHGILQGSFSDGDFRRWIVANPQASLDTSVREAANANALTASIDAPASEILPLFARGIEHIPLVDERGHLIAVALDSNDSLTIGRHTIGEGHPSFVIAEVGNNHNGSIDLAKRLVDLAVEAKADAVKFQLRDMDALYRQAGAQTAGEDLGVQYTLDLLRRFSLPAESLFEVFDHARDAGIEVMCTPWDSPSVKALADYGIAGLKIASADLTNHELITDAAGYRLPLILSTGMSRENEIVETVSLLNAQAASFALLHCQSTYPAPFKDVNLAYMDRLAELGACPVGYSGHERGWHVPVAAVARGARIVEKHFTVDRTMEGNDHTVSLLPDEFAQMVTEIRDIELAIGTAQERVLGAGEAMNRITLAKSLVATRPITKGSVIVADDVQVRSPGRGLQPNALPQLLGRTINRDLAEGDFFFEGDLRDDAPAPRPFSFRRPWGLPVRYHDLAPLLEVSNPDFVEFHFSYKDLEIDLKDHFSEKLPIGFTTHLPDLFAGDFIVDLASADAEIRERSIAELQRTIDITRNLTQWFTLDDDPIMVVTMGGFTRDRHVEPSARAAMYERVASALKQVDASGVRIAAQTMPPFPWLMGGQQYHNLFLDPSDTVEFAQSTGTALCLDASHTKLATNFLGLSFADAAEQLLPHTIHLHLVDATGVDGEGVQVGDGEIDWPVFAEQMDRLGAGLPFIPEIWQGHINNGEGFWQALDRLEAWL